MVAAPVLTSISHSVIRRKRNYPRITVTGEYFPGVPFTYVRVTHATTGYYTDIDTDHYNIVGPSLMYFWGRVPRRANRGWYDLTVSYGGLTSILTNAFKVKGK
jgi:hypothetical protein